MNTAIYSQNPGFK